MNITFYVDYRTNWGEAVYLTGPVAPLGSGDRAHAYKMELIGDQTWRATIQLPDNQGDFGYRYFVGRENGQGRHDLREEWGDEPHHFVRGQGARQYEQRDRWQDQPWDKPLYSAVFTQCMCARPAGGRALPTSPKAGDILLSCQAPMVAPDEVVAVCGNAPSLGGWDPDKAVVLSDHDYPVWRVAVSADGAPETLEFKYLILRRDTRKMVAWETCDNRRVSLTRGEKGAVLSFDGMRLSWPKGLWRGAGTAIPVFALRSNDDCGVGDFYDLLKMVDWAAATGQRFLQLLPINDTTMSRTWTDSYPYDSNSCFALHPMYVRLSELGRLKSPERQAHYEELAKELNSLPQIDYEKANNTKEAFCRELFEEVAEDVIASEEYKKFVADNSEWLLPYAAFCVLRDSRGTPDWQLWGDYAQYSRAKAEAVANENPRATAYICWIQMHLARQMAHVRRYAHSRGIALKGDIPIGISRRSVDAWTRPELFNLDCQAGAPPDDFSVMGQNWGFPTYNWEEMGRHGFDWWKARFRKMSEYFDVYRIDHVLGFFRIWQIPMSQLHGLLGIFNPALPFTPDELRHNYDFWLDVDLQTTPYIMGIFLGDFFGEYTEQVKEKYLTFVGHDRYKLRPEVATQRQVANLFDALDDTEANRRMRDGLMGLIDQVLFIEDPYEKGKYHPRISAQYTYIYRALTDYERWCFDRLYNDFFYHRHNDFWYGKAMWKLPPIIDATSMLTCAEDLGMIPACVPAVMERLQILTLDIQRMPKDPKVEFGNPAHYPYYSVCTTSTHDMGGIRQWWEEDRQKTQTFYNTMLHEGGEAPYFAEPWVCEKIVAQNLAAPSMLCILPMQDWMSINGELRRPDPRDEQINVPANPRHYWRYRMHLTLEELLAAKDFNASVRRLVEHSGR